MYNYDLAKAIADMMQGKVSYYFRGTRKVRRWWRTRWVDTGMVWQFEGVGIATYGGNSPFTVLTEEEAKAIPPDGR